ncbi:MAG: GTP cyclohydrolase I FolE, partial [Anaerolineae bacterium]|nr:GTP cyclohydrolase I FolE [Anaerolineae bacterium]NIN97967.1 GTP cyclohydrolase I FolE [Anaerolineae bacterium]NIQ80930.1 GTP cyclohydrolase I FolE [Anaerolineae bacterium]
STVADVQPPQGLQHWERTPERFARYLTHLCRPGDYDRWTTFVREAEARHLIAVPAIHFWSACSHHMLPFIGQCWVGYIPDEKILGLSKIPLLVREVARGFWMQEDLT